MVLTHRTDQIPVIMETLGGMHILDFVSSARSRSWLPQVGVHDFCFDLHDVDHG